MIKKLLFLLFLGSALMISAQQGAYYQQKVKYKMDIDVDAANFSYNGKQTIDYTNNSPDELDVVYMHLYWNAFRSGSMMDQRVRSQIDAGDARLIGLDENGKRISRLSTIPREEEGKQNIHWIKQNGKNLHFEIQETVMKVYLDKPIQPNSSTQFTMEWDAVIPMQIRRAGRNNREGIDMTVTQWYPKMAEYDYDGWATFDYIGREFHAPFADFDISIKIDQDYVIGAGGTLQNENQVKGYVDNPNIQPDRNGKVTWQWKAENILDFAWAADRDYTVESFTILGGPKIYYVYQKSERTALWEDTKPLVTKYFQIMNAQFGRYNWPSYSFIQGGDGGMEYGMCTMILGEGRSLQGLMGLMIHEGSHSWYQQMLATNESVRPWMDEGFTDYATSFVMAKLFPADAPKANPFVGTIKSYVNFTKSGKEEPASWLGDHHDSGSAYSFASYVKGELFLVQLGYIMGEENLARTLKDYYNEWNMKHPTDRDFMHIAQKVSGMDLQWFHNYWINTTKTIDYSVADVHYGDSSTLITLVNKGTVPMPIDFNILTQDDQIVGYHIPLNMMRTPKARDIYGDFKVMPYWNWTSKEYFLEIPYTREQLKLVGIDFSQRLADVNPEDNFIEVTQELKEEPKTKIKNDAEHHH